MTDFDVFVIPAADATPGPGGEIPAAGVLPESANRQAGCSESSATEPIGCERSSGWLGLWARQYPFRRGTRTSQTRHLPSGLRLGTRALFRFAAQEREQNFGFLVCEPQTGHAIMAILSER